MGGFCSGPLLGEVLTVAAASGSLPLAVGLMLVYALGMALPLFALVALWQRAERPSAG
jgi:cytochrome c biogenesis protein CcdA